MIVELVLADEQSVLNEINALLPAGLRLPEVFQIDADDFCDMPRAEENIITKLENVTILFYIDTVTHDLIKDQIGLDVEIVAVYDDNETYWEMPD
jgi:hypothetical protein